MSWPTSSGAASQFSDAEVAALQLAVANGIATYAAGEIEKLAGVPAALTDLLAAAEANCYPRDFVVSKTSPTKPATGKLVAVAATFNGDFTASNPSGNLMRIVSNADTEAHGMGAASDGKYLWIRTSAGVPTGIYPINTRAVATRIDLDVGEDLQPLIATTTVEQVATVNIVFPAVVHMVPGGAGPNAEFVTCFAIDALSTGGSTRYVAVNAGTAADGTGGTQVGDKTSMAAAVYGYNALTGMYRIVNVNDNAVQRGFSNGTQAIVPSSHTIDTTDDWYVAVMLQLTLVDVWAEVVHSKVIANPGV